MERSEMIEIVRRIQELHDEGEIDHLLDVLKRETGCPHISNLLYWPNHEIPGHPLDQDLTAEEVVDHALNYRPFAL